MYGLKCTVPHATASVGTCWVDACAANGWPALSVRPPGPHRSPEGPAPVRYRALGRIARGRLASARRGASVVLVVVDPDRGRLLDLHEELDVALGLLDPVDEQLDALLLVER